MTTICKRYSIEHCTKARESASALELGKYNHLREAHLLDVDEWDLTTHDWRIRWPMAMNDAGSADSHWCQVTSRSSTTLTIPTMTYAEIRATGMDGRRARVHFGSGDMEVRMLWYVFLFLSSALLFFGSRPSTNSVGTGFYHLPLEVEFPRAPDPLTGHRERYWSVVGLMGSYDCVRGPVIWLLPFRVFPFLLLYGVMQPRRSAPKEGDNVMAWRHVTCPGPSNTRFI